MIWQVQNPVKGVSYDPPTATRGTRAGQPEGHVSRHRRDTALQRLAD